MPPKNVSPEELKFMFEDLEEQLTDLVDEIKKTASVGLSLHTDPSRKSLFSARLSLIHSTYERFQTTYLEANSLARKLDISKDTIKALRDEARTSFFEALSYGNIGIGETSQSDTCSPIIGRKLENVSSQYRLPTISIPSFSGDIARWQDFKETFRSLIHEKEDLDNIQKFHYLKSSLKGSALQAISSISISHEGYRQAWQSLIKKYDSKRIQATFHLTKILNFKPIGKGNLFNLETFSAIVIESASALLKLGITDLSGFILTTLALRLLDAKTREIFETEYSSKPELPTWQEFSDFVQRHAVKLQSEVLLTNTASEPLSHKTSLSHPSRQVLMATDSSIYSSLCPICNKSHRIYDCKILKTLTPRERCDKIKSLKRCFNCFGSGHVSNQCESRVSCRRCGKRHHSLLHFFPMEPQRSKPPHSAVAELSHSTVRPEDEHGLNANSNLSPTVTGRPINSNNTRNAILSMSCKGQINVLLGTAIARIRDHRGHWHELRILIDSGSQRSFITRECAYKLNLPLTRNRQKLVGFGNQAITKVKFEAPCIIIPRKSQFPELNTAALVIDRICEEMPTNPVSNKIVEQFCTLELADPHFQHTRPVDFLLGADMFADILLAGSVKPEKGAPSALNTIFGWIVMGPLSEDSFHQDFCSSTILHSATVPCSKCENLSLVLNKFWETEHVSSVIKSDPQDAQCEDHFLNTYTRDETGRFIVKLPFNGSPPVLYDSKYGALNRFKNLERKFEKDSVLQSEYSKIIQEYLNKDYISRAVHPGRCYLPHHPVLKESSSTKVRIVFDASAAATNGSLNDHLLTGPKLQRDIKDVILAFRKHRIAMSADICQMYLQIKLAPEDCAFQHFFYRSHTTEALTEYTFNRLSFGLSCSPFLAMRVIKQLVSEDGKNYPAASRALLEHMYVDDLLTGMDTISEASDLQRHIIQLLDKGGFELKKWNSNCREILDDVASKTLETPVSFSNMEDSIVKLLGIQWEPKNDCLFYKVLPKHCVPTKRGIMSTIARIYDPPGYLAPAIFRAKTILQKLWEIKLDWDAPVPSAIRKRWEIFYENLIHLGEIRIPRCIFTEHPVNVTIVGFADASELGFAAAIYVRLELQNGRYSSYLLFAKTRLAPLKHLSIPRLELCGAVLLVDTLNSLRDTISDWNVTSIILCSDSSTVISWLHLPHSRLKSFVANRVARILELSELSYWHHVTSENNAADVASRGTCPSELPSHETWWSGPKWLCSPMSEWPINSRSVIRDSSELPEIKPGNFVTMLAINKVESAIENILGRFSSYTRMIRVLAYAIRFKHNLRNRDTVRSGSLSLSEIRLATEAVIRGIQSSQNFGPISEDQKGPLRSLNPFVDSVGLVRVGGRLRHAPIPYEKKYPILLPKRSHFVNLLIDHFHRIYLHAGPQLLNSLLRNKFWIIAGRTIVRSRVHLCATCHRLRVKNVSPFMGDLPESRFEQGRAFLNVGIDFAGPFLIRESQRRKATVSKAYICLFVCFSTKAVHIEVVSQLSTDALIASFDRFIARRGLPRKIFSDNGTNFVGASRRLKELYKWWNSHEIVDKTNDYFISKEVEWHFIPPFAPHFGGLWEAGIKSCKHHLIRVLGTQPVTFEEMTTVMTRIEAVLNSRPLHPNSSDPNDFHTLTPGHFLIGAPLAAPPEHDLTEVPRNRLSRWQHLQGCIGDFWRRWRQDYLHSLQQRAKWTKPDSPILPGTLVLLRDPNVPPLHWPTARVLNTFPGKDGVTRVVRVKTGKTELLRPVSRLSPLLPDQFDV